MVGVLIFLVAASLALILVPLVIAGGHATKGGPACATSQAQQHVFAHICRMVTKGDKIRPQGAAFLLQQGVAQLAGCVFNTDFAAGRQPAHVSLPHATVNAQSVAQLHYKFSILCGFCPQAVVNTQGVQGQAQTWGKQTQHKGQRCGIGPARERQQQM